MSRGKRLESTLDKKKLYYVIGIGALMCLLILIFTLSAYKAKSDATSQIAELNNVGIESSDATMVTATEDKSINEVKNETKNEPEKIVVNTSNVISNTNKVNVVAIEPKKVELHFIAPIQGEIMKDFSDTNLVYSETLKEWTVHLGIDIKAEKGSAVTASEAGKIESIKNDPRYGTTITISHENGFKTIYSNLSSADAVIEGQEVEKGQTIGSVGDSAAFEISDESHLHVEMEKDGQTVNPSLYWGK